MIYLILMRWGIFPFDLGLLGNYETLFLAFGSLLREYSSLLIRSVHSILTKDNNFLEKPSPLQRIAFAFHEVDLDHMSIHSGHSLNHHVATHGAIPRIHCPNLDER